MKSETRSVYSRRVVDRSAAIHPGRILQCFDHFVIDLRGPDSAAYFTVYAVEYSPDLGTGHVAFLRTRAHDGTERDLTLTDTPDMARRMQARLLAMLQTKDMSRGIGTSLEQEPIEAVFHRGPWTENGVSWRIHTIDNSEIDARWEQPEPPIWTAAPAGTFTDERDIVGMLAGFGAADLRIDGVPVPGAPWPDPWWEGRLGRPFSSTHVALAESSMTPGGGWWDELKG